jgi:hypothetical protein
MTLWSFSSALARIFDSLFLENKLKMFIPENERLGVIFSSFQLILDRTEPIPSFLKLPCPSVFTETSCPNIISHKTS